MRTKSLAKLCCPYCGADLKEHRVVVPRDDGIQYGLVNCQTCAAMFPVVAGVLILGAPHERLDAHAETTADTVRSGTTIVELCWLLEADNYAEALARVVVPAERDADMLFRSPGNGGAATRPIVPPRLLRKLDRPLKGRLLRVSQRRMARMLLEGSGTLTTTQVIDLFYGRFSRSEMANYFKYRFGQPRHLAALGVASVIKRGSGTLLDLACGAGHLTHYLGTPDRAVIGVDRDYFRLFIAANYVAPGADFICAAADRPLPFRTGALAGALCSDAFHLFVDKAGSLRELARVVADDGLIALARVGNREQKPNEGYELTPAGYSHLCAQFAHTVLGEGEIIDAYLRKEPPRLDRRELSDALSREKWLSVVMAKRPELLRSEGRFEVWPHAAGALGVNPIFRGESSASEELVQLRFEFPSEHYAKEDADYLKYAPRECTVPRRLLVSLAGGGGDPDVVEKLLSQFVLIGMPDRYVANPLRLGS
jgi:SAM-dependent methyltransferase